MNNIENIKNENSLIEEQIPPNNDKTFNKIKDLQTLLKKESSLKELCKKIIK